MKLGFGGYVKFIVSSLYLFVPLFERFFVFYVIHWFKCFFEVKIKKSCWVDILIVQELSA
jgi:hypothetical protein